MDIVYRKNTLYVNVTKNIDDAFALKLESNINNIMGRYNINNLVIHSNGYNMESLKGFVSRYNLEHNSNMIIK